MSSPVRIGVIGCGRITELGHVPAAACSDAVEIVAVADPDGERRRHVAELAAVRPHGSAEGLIRDGEVEAIVIASPPGLHVEHATAAAAADLPALVEKPPAPDAAGAHALAALDPAPWIGFNRRFGPLGKLGAEIPPDGPLELELTIHYRRASWRPVAVRDDALADLGAHLTDLALLLSGGGPAQVRRSVLSFERAELELELARGRAVLAAACDRPHRERVVARRPLAGTLAQASTPGTVRGLMNRVLRREHPLVASLRAQLEAFATAARGGDPGPLATAADGVRAMRLVDEARAVAA